MSNSESVVRRLRALSGGDDGPITDVAANTIEQLVTLIRDMEQYAYECGLSFGEPLERRIGDVFAHNT
jgi:hypothetical protein